MLLRVVAVAFCLIAGCAAPAKESPSAVSSPTTAPIPACPTPTLARQAYDAGEEFFGDEFPEQAFTMQLEGTVEGEVGVFLIAHAPATQGIRALTPDGEFRVLGKYYTIDADDVQGYGRDHQPDATYDSFIEGFEEDDDGPTSFLDGLSFSDYAASCTTHQGQPAIEFRYERDGLKDVAIVLQAAPYRAVAGERVDPALQDNYRVSLKYDVPTITLQTTLPRIPITAPLDVLQFYTNARGGQYMLAEFGSGTEWAPLSEVEYQLVDSVGTLYLQDPLQEGTFDLGDGDVFRFDDRDNNNMLSADDVIEYDLGPSLDIAFWDTWANGSVNVVAE
jgi:hypothetical protein